MMRIALGEIAGILCLLMAAPLMTMGRARPAGASVENAATKELRAFFDADWKQWMTEYPEMATQVGYPGQDRRWTDISPAGFAEREMHLRESLAGLEKVDRRALPAGEKLNYDMYKELLETAIEGLQYGDDPLPFRGVVPANRWMPINQMGSPADASDLFAQMPQQKVSDYENILARMETLHTQVEETIRWMQEGLKRGYSVPGIAMRDVPKQMADIAPADPMKSALLQPFQKFPPEIGAADRKRLTERAKQIYTSSIAPAFQKLHDYLVTAYIPACRESIAASALPNGADAYRYHIRWQTTLNLTPEQIHAIGLSEVKRIRGEMDQVMRSTGFTGSFTEFTQFLRTDPKFYYTNKEDLVNGYRIIAKEIDPGLAHEFGKLPRLPYGVTPIPDYKAPSQTTAYYQPGSPAAGRPGYFCVNTYKLESRPKWEMEALTLHESVPGHHLQIALGQEQEDEPEFRKNVSYSSFVEGWALYAESLGGDMGMYKDPYSKFGQLTYEMWRAVRLVVDTGMHAMGWSRQQAIDYFRENTGKTDQDITVEVDRYIVWPGQALAYKLGQMKIRELRGKAEKELGAKFDLRTFHDAVLEEGAVPLGILEAHMNGWIEMKVKGGTEVTK
ncbi:MAG TPA: DUF885 domain-containing protein [Candidatus Eisenbacteria bacterium]|nr:DUF885 domain-containing protein [Candidatus Eisenbacteria bacterium]